MNSSWVQSVLKKVEQTIFTFLYLCQTVLNSYYNRLNACLERNYFFFKGKNVLLGRKLCESWAYDSFIHLYTQKLVLCIKYLSIALTFKYLSIALTWEKLIYCWLQWDDNYIYKSSILGRKIYIKTIFFNSLRVLPFIAEVTWLS